MMPVTTSMTAIEITEHPLLRDLMMIRTRTRRMMTSQPGSTLTSLLTCMMHSDDDSDSDSGDDSSIQGVGIMRANL